MQHPPELYAGLMSGTSLDGIDAVLVDLGRAQPGLLARHYLPFDDALKNDLLALHQPGHNELHRMQLAGNQLARLYAAAVNALLDAANLPNAAIKPSAATARLSVTAPSTATPCKSAMPHCLPNWPALP